MKCLSLIGESEAGSSTDGNSLRSAFVEIVPSIQFFAQNESNAVLQSAIGSNEPVSILVNSTIIVRAVVPDREQYVNTACHWIINGWFVKFIFFCFICFCFQMKFWRILAIVRSASLRNSLTII